MKGIIIIFAFLISFIEIHIDLTPLKAQTDGWCFPGNPELDIAVWNMPKPQRDSGFIIMDNISTCWGFRYTRPSQSYLPLDDNDELCNDTSYLIETCFNGQTADTLLWLLGEGWDNPNHNNVFFTYGKYKFYIGNYTLKFLDSVENEVTGKYDLFFDTVYYKYDSLMINFTDSNYDDRSGSPHPVDYRIVYFWDSKEWELIAPIGRPLNRLVTVNVWDSAYGGPDAATLPRVTNCFTPAAPKNFALGSSSGNPYLSWSSNGETFPIRYKIYRKLNNKYGTYTNIADTTSTNYTDTEISCAGSGNWTAYYYVLAKNNSTGSDKVSSSTDTLDILYSCVSKESAGNDDNLSFALYPNYPNPFNPSTEISYQLPTDEYVSLKIYNTLGQEVRSLVRETQYTGLHKVIWDGKNRYGQIVPSGVYLYRLETKSFSKTMKMIMMK